MRKRPAASGTLSLTTALPDVNDPSVPATSVAQYLRDLIALCTDPPMIDALSVAELGTDCGTAAIARAALAWLLSKHPDVIKGDLERELRESDFLTAWRLRRMSGDLAELPWQRLAEIDRARRQAGDVRYRGGRGHG